MITHILFWLFLTPAYAGENKTQYVFIIDDSGSMSLNYKVGGQPRNIPADPNRISIFAVKALLEMLSDDDEAVVIRLNGSIAYPKKGGTYPRPELAIDSQRQIQSLSNSRQTILEELSLNGKIAAYAASHTPCVAALDQAKEALNKQYDKAGKQVLIFLTDGECKIGEAPEILPPPQDWIAGINSSQDNQLKFFLLTIKGREFTRELVDYAEMANGRHDEVDPNNPVSLLSTFATALSYAQGVPVESLDRNSPYVRKHPAAASVRLLTVTKGEGADVSFDIKGRDRNGKNLEIIRQSPGEHQWLPSENPYTYLTLVKENKPGLKLRYASASYKSTDNRTWVQPQNTTGNWEVIAIPDYRLSVQTRMRKGVCSKKGTVIAGNRIRKTDGLCIEVRITNHLNKNVTKAVHDTFEDLRADIQPIAPDEPASSAALTPLELDRSGEFFEYSLVDFPSSGTYRFIPSIQLVTDEARIYGLSDEIDVYDINLRFLPNKIDFKTLELGEKNEIALKAKGVFPTTNANFKIYPKIKIPHDCVQFSLNDLGDEGSIVLSPDASFNITAKVQDTCGSKNIPGKPISGVVKFIFPDNNDLSEYSVKWNMKLKVQVGKPKPIERTITAGDTITIDLAKEIQQTWGKGTQKLAFQLAVMPEDQSKWPSKNLYLGLSNEDKSAIKLNASGERETTTEYLFDPKLDALAPLPFSIESSACCGEGVYETHIHYLPNKDKESQVSQKVTVTVKPADFLDCYLSTLINIALAIGTVTGIGFFFNIYRKSHFINIDKAVGKIVPLEYKSNGAREPRRVVNHEISAIMQPFYEAGFFRLIRRPRLTSRWIFGRFMTWLRAGPWTLGFPWTDHYYETLQIDWTASSVYFSVTPIPKKGMLEKLRHSGDRNDTSGYQSEGYFLTTDESGALLFYFRYIDLPDFAPKNIHNEIKKLERKIKAKRMTEEDLKWRYVSISGRTCFVPKAKLYVRAKKGEHGGWEIN